MTLEILNKQHQAIKKALETGITGYTCIGTVFEEKYGKLKTRYSQGFPNMVRIEVDLPNGGMYVEGFNGNKAWEMDKIVDGRAYEALKQGAEWPSPIKSFVMFQDRGNKVDYIGEETRGNDKFYIFKLSQIDGFERKYFVQSENGLTYFASDIRPLHPKEDWREIETRFENYKIFKGLSIPMKVVDRDVASQEDLMYVEYNEIQISKDNNTTKFNKI